MPGNRRTSLVGAFLLIALGLLFLYSNLRPGLDPWPLLSRYWPLLLYFWAWQNCGTSSAPQDAARRSWLSGREIAVVLLLIVFGIGLSFGSPSRSVHHFETVERKGSEPVSVHVRMPAGDLNYPEGQQAAGSRFQVFGTRRQAASFLPGRRAGNQPNRAKVQFWPQRKHLGPAASRQHTDGTHGRHGRWSK